MPIKITVTLLDDEKGTHANVRAKQKKVTPHEDKCARLLLKLIEMYFSEIGENENRIKGAPHVH
ncbi:hypothetical protein [Candidatus Sodalis pierantonius]|uniref:hypothetical protein n=2 Tax=Sodalis TaxID=84565 RepID=UPI0011DD3784|nr:hypothetical protein [Candidatus Sodalis pierantonius]